ncbi:MAG: peptidylprolyl isomerase [Polyangiaceae bacterium]
MTRPLVAVATLAVFAILPLAACESGPVEPTTDKPATSAPAKPAATARPATTATAASTAPAEPVQAKGPFPESTNAALKDPSKAKEKAPATFKVRFETTAGDFAVECKRDWAPVGVDRFYNLVKIGFFDDVAFFRVVKTPKPFVVQFGIHGNPDVSKVWSDANLAKDDPKETNARGTLTYAMAGSPDTRSTQLFINYGDNARLDQMGFAPVCKVLDDGMTTVDKIDGTYGETASKAQGEIQKSGNKFLREKFPKLDYIKAARIWDGKTLPASSASAGPSATPSAAPSPKSEGGDAKTATPAPGASAAPK